MQLSTNLSNGASQFMRHGYSYIQNVGINPSILNAMEKMEAIEGNKLFIKLGYTIEDPFPFVKAWRVGEVKSRERL